MGINNKLFLGKSFFNSSVTDGRLENFILLYFLWREKGLIPKHVILGLDAWVLKPTGQAFLWPVLKDKVASVNDNFLPDVASVFVKSVAQVDQCNQSWEFVQHVCSIDLFRNYLMYIINAGCHQIGFRGFGVFYPTKENFAVSEVMLADGSINYGLIRRSRNPDEVERFVVADIQENGFAHLGDFNKIDGDMIKLFELFIKLLLYDKVSVTFFLTPYHPKAFELLKVSEKYKLICAVQHYFTDFAQKNGIQVVGDFNPETNNLVGSDFFDEFHPKESAMQKVFMCYG